MRRPLLTSRGSVLLEVLLGMLILIAVTAGILSLLNTSFIVSRMGREQDRLNTLVGFAARQYREQFGIPTGTVTGTVIFNDNGILIYRDSEVPNPLPPGQAYRFSTYPVLIDSSAKSFDFTLSKGTISAKQSLNSPIR